MNIDLSQVIYAPVRTEKSNRLLEKNNQLTLLVSPLASKSHIKKAVEKFFKVEALAISTLNRKGKQKRFGSRYGSRKSLKYAFVTLPEGKSINFSDSE